MIMAYRRIWWQIFLSFLIILIAAIFSITWYSANQARGLYLEKVHQNLREEAFLIAPEIKAALAERNYHSLNTSINKRLEFSDTRLTIILADGRVVADSRQNPEMMDNHSSRPEVDQARREGLGMGIRFSKTVKQKLMYVAVPLYENGRLIAFVRTSYPITAIEEALNSFRYRIFEGSLLIALLTALIGLFVSRRISAPLEEITRGVERFAKGKLEFRLREYSSRELNQLGSALNQMASQLADKLKTIDQQKNEQQAVLQSMAEGVLALNRNGRIISSNKAALHLLKSFNLIKPGVDEIQNHLVREVVDSQQLIRIINDTMTRVQLVEDEIEIPAQGYYVQVHGSKLQSSDGQVMGALVVLNDVTRLRRLEIVRRDFVANVSHEIRTPLTSIKGFVETLRDGALGEPETASRFLTIIFNQTNRLISIIEDLLVLASLEENEETSRLYFEEHLAVNVIDGALSVCQSQAAEKNIGLRVSCPADLKMLMNAPLIEQALINLIMNSIKYSPNDTEITVTCKKENGWNEISVSDQGIGIAPEQQARIFERFYRVDKARSRKMGGTGLGLAIVKHIAGVHDGKVTLTSLLGQGSTFYFRWPDHL